MADGTSVVSDRWGTSAGPRALRERSQYASRAGAEGGPERSDRRARPVLRTSTNVGGSRHLGLHHDSAAALVVDGDIVAAAQEERFTRRKHDHAFPVHAIRYCLDKAGIAPGDARLRRLLRKPFLKLECLLET